MTQLDKNIKRKYLFTDYDPNWVIQFASIRDFLSTIFTNALAIEHVGSTSIPGMQAKPVIDVLVIVEKMESFEEEKQAMTAAGYEWGEDYIAPNSLIFFKLGAGDEKVENIHIFEKDSLKTRQFLIMRDFFRAHPNLAKEYSDLKRKNHELHPDDYPAYRRAKTSFLDDMEKKAYEWKNTQSAETKAFQYPSCVSLFPIYPAASNIFCSFVLLE